MTFNLPTALTWLRILLIPVFVGVYYLPATLLSIQAKNWLAMTVFALAAITDWADGYFARKWGQTSAFGAFLDPVADKLMVISALIVLVWLDRADASLAIIIIGREIAISALREWMAEIGERTRVSVASLGKFKTVMQIIAIEVLLYQHDLEGLRLFHVGETLLVLAAALTIWSALVYLRMAWPAMRANR